MIVNRARKQWLMRDGAHTVEFAVVLPLFFVFIFALVEFGRVMMVTSLVSNAARAGCRTGIIPGKATSDVTNSVDTLLQGEGISGHTTTVTVNGSSSTDVSAAKTTDTISVVVSVPVTSISWLPKLSYTSGRVSGQFSMPHE